MQSRRRTRAERFSNIYQRWEKFYNDFLHGEGETNPTRQSGWTEKYFLFIVLGQLLVGSSQHNCHSSDVLLCLQFWSRDKQKIATFLPSENIQSRTCRYDDKHRNNQYLLYKILMVKDG